MLGPETKLKAYSYRSAEEPMDNSNWQIANKWPIQRMDAFTKSLSTNQSVGEVCNSLPTLAEKVFEMLVGEDSSCSINSVDLFSLKHF